MYGRGCPERSSGAQIEKGKESRFSADDAGTRNVSEITNQLDFIEAEGKGTRLLIIHIIE
jgi:hypothetical protein